jgi:hypothetical protein
MQFNLSATTEEPRREANSKEVSVASVATPSRDNVQGQFRENPTCQSECLQQECPRRSKNRFVGIHIAEGSSGSEGQLYGLH